MSVRSCRIPSNNSENSSLIGKKNSSDNNEESPLFQTTKNHKLTESTNIDSQEVPGKTLDQSSSNFTNKIDIIGDLTNLQNKNNEEILKLTKQKNKLIILKALSLIASIISITLVPAIYLIAALAIISPFFYIPLLGGFIFAISAILLNKKKYSYNK